jgi:adenine-specific DNA-methyltransferase
MSLAPEKLNLQSTPLSEDKQNALKALVPEAFVTGELDLNTLLDALGLSDEDTPTKKEAYGLNWAGKRDAFQQASKPTHWTLAPAPEDSVDFENSQNLLIEADNLVALKLLKKGYTGKIDLIYIDPPYNVDADTVYKDDYSENVRAYEQRSGKRDDAGNLLDTCKDKGHKHSQWLSMMTPRLLLLKQLLKTGGVICVSIDDTEVAHLRLLMDEIFGEDNFVACLHVEMSATQGMKVASAKAGEIVKNAEYILVYANGTRSNTAPLYDYRPDYDEHYCYILSSDKNSYTRIKEDYLQKHKDETIESLSAMYRSSQLFREYIFENVKNIFRFDKVTGFNVCDYEENKIYVVNKNDRSYTIYNNGRSIEQLMFLSDSFGQCDDFTNSYGLRKIRGDWWKDFYKDMGNVSKEGNIKYKNGKKPIRLIKDLCKKFIPADNSNPIILDAFGGSGSTAHAVHEWNKEASFISIQIPDSLEVLKEQATGTKKTTIQELISIIASYNRPPFLSELQKIRLNNVGIPFKVFKQVPSQQLQATQGLDLTTTEADLEALKEAQIRNQQPSLPLESVNPLHLAYEVMLKRHTYPLTAPIERITFAGHDDCFRLGSEEGALCIFATEININAIIKGLIEILEHDDSAFPSAVYMLENAFHSAGEYNDFASALEQLSTHYNIGTGKAERGEQPTLKFYTL